MPASPPAALVRRGKLTEITPDPRNANRGTERGRDVLLESMRRNGAGRSIVVDAKFRTLAGNKSAAAAEAAGVEDVIIVPTTGRELVVVQRTDLDLDTDPNAARELAIADNRAGELGLEWDAEVMREFAAAAVPMGAYFTVDELAKLIGVGGEEPRAGQTDPEAVPPERPTTIKRGDLFTLGTHRLLCGDSTAPADVQRLTDGATVDLVFTSPPYGQQRDYGAAIDDWDGLMRGVFDHLPAHETTQVLVNLGLIHQDNEWSPYWAAWIDWMREHGWRRFGWYVWDQGFGLPGDWHGRLAPSFEFVFHFNRSKAALAKHVASKMAGRATKGKRGLREKDGVVSKFSHATGPDDAYVYPDSKIPDSVIRVTRQCGGVGHPAPFSVAFAVFVLRTWPGASTYEPFSGSGTQIIAAEQLGRRCYAMEIEPQYVQVTIDRWEAFTGAKASLIGTNGKSTKRAASPADRRQRTTRRARSA